MNFNREIRKLETVRGQYTLAFSSDGRWLASGSYDGVVTIWELPIPASITSAKMDPVILNAHTREVMALAFSSDGRFLASASKDMTVKLWVVGTWHEEKKMDAGGEASSVAFSPDSRTLVSATFSSDEHKHVKLWEVPSGNSIKSLGDAQGVGFVVFSPDGKSIVVGDLEQGVEFWDVASDQMRFRLPEIGVLPSAGTFSSDGRLFAVGFNSGELAVWKVQDLPN